MPDYIKKLLLKFKHGDTCNVQRSSHRTQPMIYIKETQDPIPDDTTHKINKDRINVTIQVVRGSCTM